MYSVPHVNRSPNYNKPSSIKPNYNAKPSIVTPIEKPMAPKPNIGRPEVNSTKQPLPMCQKIV